MQDDASLNFRVILGHEGGQGIHGSAVETTKAGGGVSGLPAGEQRYCEGEEGNAQTPAGRNGKALAGVQETGGNNDICLPVEQHVEQGRDLGRVVLPISIQANDQLIAVLLSKFQARLHRAANAQVNGMAYHMSAAPFGCLPCIILGAIINDQDAGKRDGVANAANDFAYGSCFVVGRNENEQA